jgi:Golgi phosphoprotein 3
MLSFVEEIMLLLLDDTRGRLVDMPLSAFNFVIAGAALMDLAIRNRIDTDLERLVLADPTPTGDDILDDALARIAEPGGKTGIVDWIDRIAASAEDYQARALGRLVAQRILREENGRFLWVFHTRRYPLIDDREPREVRARLRQILLTDEIPEPRDIVLICLIEAARLTGLVLTAGEAKEVKPRLEQLGKMDLIGQAVARTVADIRFSIGLCATTMT